MLSTCIFLLNKFYSWLTYLSRYLPLILSSPISLQMSPPSFLSLTKSHYINYCLSILSLMIIITSVVARITFCLTFFILIQILNNCFGVCGVFCFVLFLFLSFESTPSPSDIFCVLFLFLHR